MLQVFANKEKIGKITKTGNTTAQLASSVITVGTKQYTTGNLTLDTSIVGNGGIDVSVQNYTFYYVYAIEDVGAIHLIASTSEQKPAGYSKYKKVGAFYTKESGQILDVVSTGEYFEMVGFYHASMDTTNNIDTVLESKNTSLFNIDDGGGDLLITSNYDFIDVDGEQTLTANNANPRVDVVTQVTKNGFRIGRSRVIFDTNNVSAHVSASVELTPSDELRFQYTHVGGSSPGDEYINIRAKLTKQPDWKQY